MNIYVGNLHFDLSEDELKKAFEEYGEVKAVKIISDKVPEGAVVLVLLK
jgi:RNA recognition motif-containing protein